LILGTLFGILLAVIRIYGKFPLPYVVIAYERILRGIPLLVIFFLLYFGLFQLGIALEPFDAAIIGLGLRSAAYQAQIFRTSINSIPEGQMIAARSLGMSKISSIFNIIIPQMLRLSVPGWSNEFTIVLKDTSIAFSIGVIELMRQGRYIYVSNPDYTLTILLIIALIYFILVFSINKVLSYLEKKYKMSGFEVGVER
jgi:polar amino acid transport system permease protein